jgi:hypothetical protein
LPVEETGVRGGSERGRKSAGMHFFCCFEVGKCVLRKESAFGERKVEIIEVI